MNVARNRFLLLRNLLIYKVFFKTIVMRMDSYSRWLLLKLGEHIAKLKVLQEQIKRKVLSLLLRNYMT
jgi:hypothetical protein